jgi:hypothetical protein
MCASIGPCLPWFYFVLTADASDSVVASVKGVNATSKNTGKLNLLYFLQNLNILISII